MVSKILGRYSFTKVLSILCIVIVHIFLFSVMSTNELRNMIRQSDVEGLEECILDGHGSKLLGENAADNKIRAFIKAVPSYLVKTYCFLLFSNYSGIRQHNGLKIIL